MANDKIADQTLFDEFPPVSREEWEKVIEKDLRGADYREKLNWNTGEGVDVQPFYRREDLEVVDRDRPIPSLKKEKNEWTLRQPLYDQQPDRANKTARSAIERGAEALQVNMRVHQTEGMLGGDVEGTSLQHQEDFDTLLKDIPLENIALHFDTSMISPVLLAMLHNSISEREIEAQNLAGTLLYDPYAYTATNGHLPKPEKEFIEEAVQMVKFCNTHFRNLRCLGIDAKTYHNTGATIVEELAMGLATGSEYLAKLSDDGLSADEIAPNVHFSFSVGSNYFLEIAKFRAARLLWKKIVEAYSPDEEISFRAYIHAETSEWNKTVSDPYTNMLRSTTEGMSAAIAGCDSLTIHPFDLSFDQPDDFSQRIARNSQIIFKEEAYLDQVYDPGAGSYYIEILTDKIASEAWKLFQEIEKQGGMLKAITNGVVAQIINESREKRDRMIAQRGRVFVGTNQYPNAEDNISDKLDTGFRAESLLESDEEFEIDTRRIVESLAEVLKRGARLGDIVPHLMEPGKQLFRPVQPYRGSEVFEALRLAVEKHESTPSVFLMPIGDRKRRRARASFASNFFGCAGYEIEDHIGFENVEKAIKEVKESQPEIIVICSSDEEYPKLVPKICKEKKLMEPRPILVLAGNPGEQEVDTYSKAGVDAFIHLKSNVLETLKAFHQQLGIIL